MAPVNPDQNQVVTLKDAEKKVFANVRNGAKISFGAADPDKTIRGLVLRHLILGLPVEPKEDGSILLKVASLIGLVGREARCPITGVGFDIEGATIEGDLDLDSAIGEGGAPIHPLAFTNCEFMGNISARDAHLARLSLTGCTFIGSHRFVDLTGACLGRELGAARIKPKPDNGALWVFAPGLCVGGGIDLSGATLRAPDRSREDGSERDKDDDNIALDLSLATIEGDLCLAGATFDGRLKLRSTHIRGDMWLSRAKITNPGETTQAILLQGGRIEGFLATRRLNDPPEDWFSCTGNIILAATEVGRSAVLMVPSLLGNIRAPDLVVRDDLYLHGEVLGTVELNRSSIGGSLDISRLALRPPRSAKTEPQTGADAKGEAALCLEDARIGATLRIAAKPTKEILSMALPQGFTADGPIDLRGTTCDTLDDNIGRSWDGRAVIRMNHFIYRRTGWPSKPSAAGGDPDARRSIYGIIAGWREAARARGLWPSRQPSAGPGGSPPATAWRDPRKTSYRIVSDWIQSRRADGLLPWRFFPTMLLSADKDFCEPWQHRRNWIYQQYASDVTRNPYVSIARHKIRDDDYRPQPFEQAIRVARAEGRDDFATQFEVYKQRLEWRLFNRRVRWGLGILAITLSALWLIIMGKTSWGADAATMIACLVTIGLMIFGSWVRDRLRRHIVVPLLETYHVPTYLDAALVMIILVGSWFRFEGVLGWIAAAAIMVPVAAAAAIWGTCIAAIRVEPMPSDARRDWVADGSSKALTWLVYWIPALVLLVATRWIATPFHFILGLLIFTGVRLTAVFAHQLMRFGFGYLRRPIFAVATLIAAFLLGWWGTHLANVRNMLVVNAEPVAPIVGPARHAAYPPGYVAEGPVRLMGSRPVAAEPDVVRELPCAATISEPLFALDVLIPIVDLGEERRCEVRRIAEYVEPERVGDPLRHRLNIVDPDEMNAADLVRSIPDLPLNDHRFWWWAKALYAIAGWFIVSLSILTFAQVNKLHAEPPTEHK